MSKFAVRCTCGDGDRWLSDTFNSASKANRKTFASKREARTWIRVRGWSACEYVIVRIVPKALGFVVQWVCNPKDPEPWLSFAPSESNRDEQHEWCADWRDAQVFSTKAEAFRVARRWFAKELIAVRRIVATR